MVFIICLKSTKFDKQKKTIIFSEFLSEVDNGRVVEVEIQGNNINGILSNGKKFSTYSPNDPNLIEKLTDKGCKHFSCAYRRKNAIIVGYFYLGFQCFINCSLDFLYETNARRKGGAMGFGRSKAKLMNELKAK